ncbi:MAG TPA: hypothetical protein VMY18_09090, partial [Acidobacteriota bacterium]|nr:hypothetical protein [Acidobacteriota bacterium]
MSFSEDLPGRLLGSTPGYYLPPLRCFSRFPSVSEIPGSVSDGIVCTAEDKLQACHVIVCKTNVDLSQWGSAV